MSARAFINKEGVVLEVIDNNQNSGRVRLGTEESRAGSEDGTVIQVGEKIKVVKVDGTRVIVNTIKEEN